MDPGMRAPDEFSDITSEGYNEWAKRAAERGGAKEYATSVEEEQADESADTLRNRTALALSFLAARPWAGRPVASSGAGMHPWERVTGFANSTHGGDLAALLLAMSTKEGRRRLQDPPVLDWMGSAWGWLSSGTEAGREAREEKRLADLRQASNGD